MQLDLCSKINAINLSPRDYVSGFGSNNVSTFCNGDSTCKTVSVIVIVIASLIISYIILVIILYACVGLTCIGAFTFGSSARSRRNNLSHTIQRPFNNLNTYPNQPSMMQMGQVNPALPFPAAPYLNPCTGTPDMGNPNSSMPSGPNTYGTGP